MSPRLKEPRSFREWWALHALRYGLILTGIFAWMWDAPVVEGVLIGSLLLALLLLLELPLYGPGHEVGHPIWGILQIIAGATAFVVAPGIPSALILCAVIAGVAAVLPLKWSIVCLVAIFAASAIALLGTNYLSASLALIILYTLSVGVGHLFALRLEDNEKHRRTVRELEEAQRRIARFAETTRELAAAEERQRLAEEIHDSLGHALVATLLQVQVAKKLVQTDAQAAQQRLQGVEHNVRQTLESVRKALRHGKRNRSELPLHVALENLAADFEAAGGPQVELSFRPDAESVSDVSLEVADVLYRTTQEALTNAVRHGKAQRIRIEAEASGQRLYLRIADDGLGSDGYTPGMGLSGMASRVQSVGGTLRFDTALGEGFQVEVGVMRR